MNVIFDGRVIQDHFPGIARYAYNLLAALPAHLRDDDALLALRLPDAPNARYQWSGLIERGVRVHDYPMPVFSAANLLRRPNLPAGGTGNTVLHFPYYMRPYRTRQPAVTTIHDLITLIYPLMAPSVLTRISIRVFNALSIRASRVVITVSRSAADDLERHFPGARAKTVVIYEAADGAFRPQPREQTDLARAKYGLPQMFALFIASNKPHKNLVRLVEAWQKVIRDWGLEIGDVAAVNPQSPISDLQSPLLVIGGHQDPRYTQAAQRVAELGIGQHVKFIGAVPNEDLPALYSACTLFVFPSLYEGFGLPPLEAMSCGAPLACSNASALPEVAGTAAVMFDPTRPDEIAAACRRVLADPFLQADLRQRSLTQAARFTWDATAHTTMDIYRSILR